MNPIQSVNFLSPEEIATRELEEVSKTKLPNLSDIFKDRELRLRQLAAGHAMRDFLIFTADLSSAQHKALNDEGFNKKQSVATRCPSVEQLQASAQKGLPPLELQNVVLDSVWIDDLNFILDDVLKHLASEAATRRVIQELKGFTPEVLNQQAQRLLSGVMLGLNLGTAPLIASALQVYWARVASATAQLYPNKIFPQIADATVCPCCGSKPVASINTVGADVGTSRYLHCSLCQTKWHMTRIKCTHCESTKGVAYQSLVESSAQAARNVEPATTANEAAVSVETCDECHHYLKIVNMAKDYQVEPVADDLATVTLDLLISDAGYTRSGINLMLLFGPPADDARRDESDPKGSFDRSLKK